MIKKNGMLLGALILLSACSQAATPPEPALTPPAFEHLAVQLESAHMQVIQQGDRLTILIPTDRYFDPLSTTVKENRQTALRQMAQFVKSYSNQYPNSVIKVTGYTDRVFNHRTQLQLSQSYAEAISAYIFDAGINPRRIATQGRGSSDPIAENTDPSGAALNRRVVIQVN